MCDPITAVLIGGLQGGAAILQSQGIKAQGRQQAAILEQQGQVARQQSEFTAQRQREQADILRAKRIASFAKGGVDVTSSGTSSLVQEIQAETAALQIQSTLIGGKNKQNLRLAQAQNTINNANAKATSTLITGAVNAGTTIAGGVSSPNIDPNFPIPTKADFASLAPNQF